MWHDSEGLWTLRSPIPTRAGFVPKSIQGKRLGHSMGVFVIAGRGFRFGSLLTFWHKTPNGRDIGECRGKLPGLHLWHGHLQVHPWQIFRMRWVDRCSWCGEGSRPRHWVNCGTGGPYKGRHWWSGHVNTFHMDCLSLKQDYSTCSCVEPVFPANSRAGYGTCLSCGRFYPWRRGEQRRALAKLAQSMPYGVRPDEDYRITKLELLDYYKDEQEVGA